MRCEFGYCMICDKEIAKACDSCSKRTPTNDYTQVQVEWSNGAKMDIAVCTTCATSHAWTTPDAKKRITEAHWDAWDKLKASYDKEIVIV